MDMLSPSSATNYLFNLFNFEEMFNPSELYYLSKEKTKIIIFKH